MEFITSLPPAEAMFLLNGKLNHKAAMKAIFLSLMDKKVLAVAEEEQYVASRDATFVFRYIIRGDNFSNCQPTEYERYFLKAFRGDANSRFLLPNFVKLAYRNADSKTALGKEIFDRLKNKGLARQTLIDYFTGRITRTPQGEQVYKQIKSEMDHAAAHLGELLKTGSKNAGAYISGLGAYLLLLPETLLSQIKEMQQMQAFDESTFPQNYYADGIFDSSDGCWSHSGCSGCGDGHGSGCSGCGSGCSGCGGCGGD